MCTWYIINPHPVLTIMGEKILTPVLVVTTISRHVKDVEDLSLDLSSGMLLRMLSA
jgi:hypothetical protein